MPIPTQEIVDVLTRAARGEIPIAPADGRAAEFDDWVDEEGIFRDPINLLADKDYRALLDRIGVCGYLGSGAPKSP